MSLTDIVMMTADQLASAESERILAPSSSHIYNNVFVGSISCRGSACRLYFGPVVIICLMVMSVAVLNIFLKVIVPLVHKIWGSDPFF